MDFEDNYNILIKQLNFKIGTKKVTHRTNINSPLLPFKTSEAERVIFENGFYRILGEFSRIMLSKKWDTNLNIHNIFSKIKENENVDIEEGTEKYLEKLINEYLFNEKGELKILSPYLLMYIPLSNNKRARGQIDIAIFMRDIFCQNNENLKKFLSNKETNYVVIDFILNNISTLHSGKVDTKYIPVLNYIPELFNEDINFALKHEKFLLENIDKIFAYYYFFYVSQLSLKLNKGFTEDLNKNDPLYFLLDWESASKNRKSIKIGYSFLKNKNKTLFVKINLIEQMNILLGTHGLLETDLLKHYNNLSEENQKSFIFYLRKWISNYRYVRNFDEFKYSPDEYLDDLSDDFKELDNSLFRSLNDKKGISQSVKSAYALNIEEIGKKYFLKRRGSYGYILNINKDMLFVITALCIKDRKLRLNKLFEEYEKRGLYFDMYSKEEIIKFLTKLNLIDKKSDSGDAQYVKPIL